MQFSVPTKILRKIGYQYLVSLYRPPLYQTTPCQPIVRSMWSQELDMKKVLYHM